MGHLGAGELGGGSPDLDVTPTRLGATEELCVVWLDRHGRVVHIEPRLEPCPEDRETCPTWTSPRPARFVLELKAGSAAERGLEPGSLLLIDLDGGLRR